MRYFCFPVHIIWLKKIAWRLCILLINHPVISASCNTLLSMTFVKFYSMLSPVSLTLSWKCPDIKLGLVPGLFLFEWRCIYLILFSGASFLPVLSLMRFQCYSIYPLVNRSLCLSLWTLIVPTDAHYSCLFQSFLSPFAMFWCPLFSWINNIVTLAYLFKAIYIVPSDINPWVSLYVHIIISLYKEKWSEESTRHCLTRHVLFFNELIFLWYCVSVACS